MDTINDRIAHCITITGLTKTAFAKKINLSQPHISKIALGYTSPTDRTISDICREFNISETWLRTGEGEIFTHTPEATAVRLAREYGLDDLGRQIMGAYLKLDEDDRLSVGRLIQNIIDERTTPVEPDTRPREEKPVTEWTEEEINAEAEEYRQSLLEEKRRAESGSASAGPSSSGTA